jgi:hypothetical protein
MNLIGFPCDTPIVYKRFPCVFLFWKLVPRLLESLY